MFQEDMDDKNGDEDNEYEIYDISLLKDKDKDNLPLGVNYKMKERYLAPNEFHIAFGMSIEEFDNHKRY